MRLPLLLCARFPYGARQPSVKAGRANWKYRLKMPFVDRCWPFSLFDQGPLETDYRTHALSQYVIQTAQHECDRIQA